MYSGNTTQFEKSAYSLDSPKSFFSPNEKNSATLLKKPSKESTTPDEFNFVSEHTYDFQPSF